MAPASIAAAIAIPLLMQSILHMPSLPVLVMLFPLAWTTDRIVIFISGSTAGPTRGNALCETGVVVVASTIILWEEYRLTVPGIIFGVTGILSCGISKALLSLACRRIELNKAPPVLVSAHHGFIILTAVFGLVVTGFSSYAFEDFTHSSPILSHTSVLLFINFGSTAAAILSGNSLLAYSPTLFVRTPPEYNDDISLVSNIVASSASSTLIFWLSMLSNPISYVSPVQHIVYYTTVIALLALSGKSTNTSSHYHSLRESERMIPGPTFRANSPAEVSRFISKTAVLRNVFLGLTLPIIWLLVSAIITSNNAVPADSPAQLDKNYVPESRFDIVVSMYDEDPVSVKTMLASIKSTTFLETIHPRVIIYTKKPSSDLTALRNSTGADTVQQLENRGREGGTYLHHIVTNWDNLAQQTMFIQAHAHNMRELIPRIDNYLVEKTGMLNLGFAGVLCNSKDCSDRWGWEDQWGMVPSLYKRLHHNETCEEPVLLSYKGQFIASANRIRGIPLGIYEELLSAITSTTGWSHNETIIGNNLDRPDAPYFGYTVERLWNLLLQCSNLRIATMCPSLLSQRRRFGRIDDCQCLD
ncbi:uncharacterized protein Bfra_012222 [Botrytis fragariae]|uniref:Uncharacterized protein n=1 Tax=Botrytis fragariae TaxID=1964551 RepID=A0A8H6EE46_9HELO|nr:uncharacterized protein Bfra_012222 [Botrytis fragariae]KAF5868575.1 hypothetical protein Bfra_012222 [Botrytis fragariae]